MRDRFGIEGHPPWNIWEGIIVIVMTSLGGSAITTLLYPFLVLLLEQMPGGSTPINQLLISSVIQTSVILGLVWLFVRVKYKASWEQLGLQPPEDHRWYGRGVIHGVILFMGMIIITNLIVLIFPIDVPPQDVASVIMTGSTPWELLVPLVVTGFFAPLSEEILFRGFIFGGLRQRLNVWPSMIIASIIFGCMHFDLYRSIPLTLGGLWLNWLYVKSGSLYPAMLAHGVWNSIMTIILFTQQN